MKRFAFIAALLFSLGAPSGAEVPLPSAPARYVLDEPGTVDERAMRTLESLLIEHDRLTGEQVVIAVFQSLQGEDVADYTNRIFQKWGIGQRGKDNGVLLAIYWNEHQTRIEVGYGLEGVLTDARSKRILTETLAPGLRSGQTGLALQQSAFEILRAIGSPLVESGQAETILRSGGWAPYTPRLRRSSGMTWFPILFLGIVLLTILFNILSSAEAHFTRKGWTHARPLGRLRDRMGSGWWGGGGGFGGGPGGGGWGGGGGGGFGGGGGRSGGGGASGSW